MSANRTLIKKIIFKVLGEKGYAKAYAKGKLKDIKNGVLDEAEATFLPYFIKDTDTVLDIGANYGHYAVDMANLCPSGEVHAFEPVPFTFSVLTKICAHYSKAPIFTYHAAVSNKKGKINMTVPLLDFGAPNTGVAYIGKSAGSQSKTVAVETLKIDDMTFKQPISFIKIDIEGHEPKAFKGMEKLLLNDAPVILIEFSHNCLNRAATAPAEFATYIKEILKMDFYQIRDKKLKHVTTTTPADGYYFLIPNRKKNNFKELIA